MQRSACLVLCLTLAPSALAQSFDLPHEAIAGKAALASSMPALAKRILAVYKDSDRARFLRHVFRLQMVAGDDAEALQSASQWRRAYAISQPERARWVNVQYEIDAAARLRQQSGGSFDLAYANAFRDRFRRLDDSTAALVIRALQVSPSLLESRLQRDLRAQKAKDSVGLSDALRLIDDYQAAETYRAASPLIAPLIDADDARRYLIQNDVKVRTRDGGILCALVVRPRGGPAKLPALLELTIYADPVTNLQFSARPAASHGYASIVGLVRGKGCSPDSPVPYVRDASDAAALIDWIAAQPWSDGRVGMYGGSYSGGSAWAATKNMPKALKAIAVGAPVAPGIDVPMEGNVFWNFVYPWPFYTTDMKRLDNEVYADSARWNRLNHDWYASGRAYRDLDKIDGTPNPIFDSWISHPAYDAYWAGMIPHGKEFARIDIPVLQTAGYFYGGPGSAVYYFTQHERYDPKAEDYLVIGPWDHGGAQHGTVTLLGDDAGALSGYQLDPVALVDVEQLRYEWFDFVLKGAPRPPLLADKVNYEVTGANLWKHAPSLAAMKDDSLRFYLAAGSDEAVRTLSRRPAASGSIIPLKVDLADRSDVDRTAPGGGVLDTAVDTWNGIEFVSDPFPSPIETSGLFSGHLELVCNKKDFDFEIDLYERTSDGKYFQLAPYWSRASYVADRSQRHLLTPGKRERLDFQAIRLMSHRLQKGSRLVAVLSVIKTPDRQINYGTGRDVSIETIRDARQPLEIQWSGKSYIDLPVWK